LAYHAARFRFCFAFGLFAFCLLAFAFVVPYLLFAICCWGFYFYVAARFIYIHSRTHKGISLNTKTTCGNRNNKKSQSAHTHT